MDCLILPQADFPQANVISISDSAQATLAIKEDSLQGYAETLNKIFDGLKRRHPKDTFFEDMPDFITESHTFKVRSARYIDAYGMPAAALYAYCELNYRYIYCVALQNKSEIPYETLRLYTSINVNRRPIQWTPGMLASVIGCVILGLFFILYDVRKKHFWPQSTGIITDVEVYLKSGMISIVYRLGDGREIQGEAKRIGAHTARHYARRIGDRVKISYSPKSPFKIHILNYYEGYFLGFLLLFFAALGTFLTVFHL